MANHSIKIPRGEKGRQFAELILDQKEVLANGEPDDSFITNPVIRAIRAQARQGVGSEPGQLPAAFAAHLCDRLFGKESEKLAVQTKGRPFAEMTPEALAARMELLAKTARETPTEH